MPTDIRQLTKAGEQFYPQTHLAALVGHGDNGEAIDDQPTPGSKNIATSGGTEKSVHGLQQQMQDLASMTPVAVVDGKFMLHDGEHDNSGFKYYKYEIEPNRIYFFSGRFGATTNAKIVYVYSNDEYIGSYGDYDEEHGVTYKDESFTSPANSAYAYLNVSKRYESAFSLAEYAKDSDDEITDTIALRSCGLLPDASWMHRFYNGSSGLVANKNMAVFRFKVEGSKTYTFSNMAHAGNNAQFVVYSDQDDIFLEWSGKGGSLTEDVTYTDEPVTTPAKASYVYFNVPIYSLGMAWFNAVPVQPTIKGIEDNTLQPLMSDALTPDDIVYGKFTLGTEERENANFQIWRYDITEGKAYGLNHVANNTNTPYVYYFDEDDNVLGNSGLHGATDLYTVTKNYVLVPPAGAAYMKVNVSKFYTKSTYLTEYDTADRTNEIISKLTRNGYCKLDGGVFYVNALELPPNTHLEGTGNNTVVVLSGTGDGYAVKLTRYNKVSNIRFLGAVSDITITEPDDIETISIGNRHGILLLGSGNGSMNPGNQVTDCSFRNFSGGAITLDNTYYHARNGMLVSDCHVMNCGVGINIAYYAEFNRFTNVIAQGCSYGLINNGGNNNFVNCDFSANGIGVYFNGASGKAVRYDGTSGTAGNTAHGIMSGCTINHSGFNGNDNPGYAIVYIDTAGGYLFTGIQLAYGKIYMRGSEAIQICNARIGFNTTIEASCSHLIVMSNVTVINDSGTRQRLRIYAYTNDNMDTIVTNYEEDGNPKLFRLINSFLPNGNPASVSVLTD